MKQEEIRAVIKEVINAYTDDVCLYPGKNCEFHKGRYCVEDEGAYKCLMKRLGEFGVVIKDRRYGMGMDTRGGYNWKDVFFVKPLIKEESDGNNEVS